MKNNQWQLNQLQQFVILSMVLLLSSCGSKPDNSAMSSGTMSSSSPSPAATSAAPSSSPSATSSSSSPAMASPEGEGTLSAAAQKLGVQPTDATTCPSSAPVKGKVTKKRGDIYHVPNSPNYAQVKPSICFADTATAEKAGFRAPKAQ